jgi:hypothetical protein
MTYITKYLASIEELKKELETHPENIKYYMKYMAINGPSESVNYLNKKIKTFLEKQ